MKFVRLISGPPPPCDIYNQQCSCKPLFMGIWGPILRAVLKNKGSANQPKMDKLKKISIIYFTKSKLKGGQLIEKNANFCILGTKLRAILDISGGLPIGPQWTNLKILQLFLIQNQN